MKELIVTGGKGGCGKTTVAASFAYLAKNCVVADCDVDSPNLGIVAQSQVTKRESFLAKHFEIDNNKCTNCGLCREKCAFNAINKDFQIVPLLCESCGLCMAICPQDAIREIEGVIGHWKIGTSRFGPFLDAYLQPGAENSGKLVTLIRKKAQEKAEECGADGIVIDGPPGTGCPVIASITGTDLAIAVVEPSLSGIHDVGRIIELTSTLKTPIAIVINKADISRKNTSDLIAFAKENDIPILGELPYDKNVNTAQSHRETVVEYAPESILSIELKMAWNKILDLLARQNDEA